MSTVARPLTYEDLEQFSDDGKGGGPIFAALDEERGDRAMKDKPAVATRSPRRWWHRHRWTIRLVAVAGLMVALTLFAAANFVLVELRLIVWGGDVRLSWALLGAGAVGFVLGLVAPRLLR